jgi:hypothetical protein
MLSFVRPDDLEGLVHVCKTFHQGIMKLAWKECYIDRMKSNYSFGISLPPVLDFEEYCSQNLDLYSNSPWCKHVEKLTIELQRLDAYDLDDDLEELFDFVKQLKSLKRLRVLVLESDGNFEVQKFCADVVSFHSNKMEELQIDFGRYRGDQSRFCLREDFLKSISKSQLKSFSITLGHYIDESKILNALPNSITNLTLMLGSHTVINFSVLAELRLDFLKIVDGVVPKDELSPFIQTIRKVSSLVLELVSCPSDDFEKALRDSLDNLKKLVLEVKEEDIKSIVLLKCSQNLESAILTGPNIVAGLDISEMSPKLQYLQIADYRCPKDIAQKLIDHAKENESSLSRFFQFHIGTMVSWIGPLLVQAAHLPLATIWRRWQTNIHFAKRILLSQVQRKGSVEATNIFNESSHFPLAIPLENELTCKHLIFHRAKRTRALFSTPPKAV